MFSFENIGSKFILKLSWIGLQSLKHIFGLENKAQTPPSNQFQENFVTVVMGLYMFS